MCHVLLPSLQKGCDPLGDRGREGRPLVSIEPPVEALRPGKGGASFAAEVMGQFIEGEAGQGAHSGLRNMESMTQKGGHASP